MSSNKQTAPAIRFKGCTDDWEQRELGELVSKAIDNRGKTPPTQEKGIYPLLEIASIGGYFPDYSKVSKYVDDDTYNTWFRAHLKENDILFSTVGNAGLATLMDNFEGATVAQNIVGFRAKNSNVPEFLLQMFKLPRNLKKAKRIEMGAVQPSIKVSQLIHVRYQVPTSKKEQIKIGCFFKHLDDTIALHQHQLNNHTELKRAVLQNVFPKNGEKIPEVRFDGFTEEWEQRKLGDVGSVAMNRRIFKEQTTEKGDIPFYKIGTFGGKPDAFIPRALFEEYKSKYPYPEIGDILISASGSIGRTVEYMGKEEYFQDSNIVWVRHEGRIDNKFLKQFYSIVEWKGLEGSTIQRLYNKSILDTTINLPSIEEQREIGVFFQQVDDTIALQQQKVNDYNLLKKIMLQQMFV